MLPRKELESSGFVWLDAGDIQTIAERLATCGLSDLAIRSRQFREHLSQSR
jgi:hypothetical protein